MTDAFKKLYDDITGRKAKPQDFEPYVGGNGRIDRVVDLIINEDFPRSGTLVDIGGATGNLGYALRDVFARRITIDIANGCRDAAVSKGNSFICANVDECGIQCPPGTVDLIVALDFIEHILDPEKFARECFRVLKSGGKVLINTPNIQYWRHLHSLVVEGHFPHTSGDKEVYHGGHVAFFNKVDMNRIFYEAGGFVGCTTHSRGLVADPPPPIWTTISRVSAQEMCYADLIFSCTKP